MAGSDFEKAKSYFLEGAFHAENENWEQAEVAFKASQNIAKPAKPSKAAQSLPEPPKNLQYLSKPHKAAQSLNEQGQMESEWKNMRLL